MKIELAVKIDTAVLIEFNVTAVEIELIPCYTAGSISTVVILKSVILFCLTLKKFHVR